MGETRYISDWYQLDNFNFTKSLQRNVDVRIINCSVLIALYRILPNFNFIVYVPTHFISFVSTDPFQRPNYLSARNVNCSLACRGALKMLKLRTK